MIEVLGYAAALVALAMILSALVSSDRRMLGKVAAGRGARCLCCGYSTEGLEEARCPECGSGFDGAAALAIRRRRRGLAGRAVVLGALAGLCVPVVDAIQNGAAHPMPSLVLVGALRVCPSWHAGITRELQGRADAGQLGAWTSTALARVCAHIVETERDGAVRRDVSWLLTRVAKHSEQGALRAMVADRDPAVRALGVEALRVGGEVGCGTAERLNHLALSDASALVRKRAIDAMRYRGDDTNQTRSTMLLALEDPSDGVRQRALVAIGDAGRASEESVRAVGAKAQDASEDVRWIAAVTLGRMAEHRPEAVDALSRLLEDASPMVRACAAISLGESATSRAWVLPRLLGAAVGDEDELVRGVALDAIRAMRGRAAEAPVRCS